MGISVLDSQLDRTQPIPRQLYDLLRRSIVDNSLRPGERISEAALAQKFDVSRTPLRAALQQLANEGLVAVRPQVGTLVAKQDPAKLKESVIIRSALERAVVEELASTKTDLNAIESIMTMQFAATETDDYATFFHHDEAFHCKLAELAGMPTSWKLIQSVKGHVDRQRYSLMARIPMRSRRAFWEHKMIIKRVREGDVSGASRAMAEHVASVFDLEE